MTKGGKLMNCLKKSFLCVSLVCILVSGALAAEKVTLWTWYGSGLGEILREMIKNDFTKKTGIEVDVQLVSVEDIINKLLLAYLGGEAPDIVELYSNQAVELGIRGALTNLNTLPGIKNVTAQINSILLPAISYKSALYALPGEVNWSWTYYRTDIFKDLGLGVPETWEDIKAISLKLRARDMDTFYYYQGDAKEVGKLLPLVYQRKSDIYKNDGTASNLDSPENIAAFKELVSLHNEYKLVIDDPAFYTFSIGQTPLQILQNWYYAGFEVTAPHITGKWDITYFPGTKQKDGSLDRTNTGKMLVWSMVSSTKKKEAAWKLLEWLSSTEFVTNFIQTSHKLHKNRLFFANINALDNAPFPQEKMHIARESLATFRMQTAVIGGHVANRYIEFAFNKAVVEKADPETVIKQAAKESTDEIQRKLKEFDKYIKDLYSK